LSAFFHTAVAFGKREVACRPGVRKRTPVSGWPQKDRRQVSGVEELPARLRPDQEDIPSCQELICTTADYIRLHISYVRQRVSERTTADTQRQHQHLSCRVIGTIYSGRSFCERPGRRQAPHTRLRSLPDALPSIASYSCREKRWYSACRRGEPDR